MPHEPKKRHSRARQGKRRASISFTPAQSVKCPNCSNQMLSHAICKHCGYYKGKHVLAVAQKEQDKKTA